MRRERAIQREREREREARNAEREFCGESWMPAVSCYADELPTNGREPWFDDYECEDGLIVRRRLCGHAVRPRTRARLNPEPLGQNPKP